MSRGLSGAQNTSLSGKEVCFMYFIKINHDTDPVLFWQGVGEYIDSSDTYYGTDGMLEFATVSEELDLAENEYTVSLAGFNTDILNIIKNEDHEGLEVEIKIGVFDSNLDIIGSLKTVKRGTISHITTTSEQKVTKVTVYIAGMNNRLALNKIKYHNDTDQQTKQPGDTIFENMAREAGAEDVWKFN